MYFPVNLGIASLDIPTMWVILGLSGFYFIFVIWYEGRKDGFDEENILNLIFLSLIFGSLGFYGILKLYNWLSVYYLENQLLNLDLNLSLVIWPFLFSLTPVFYFSKRLKWSKYRILDIYSLGFSLVLIALSLGEFLIYGGKEFLFITIITLVLYFKLFRYRGYRYTSGLLFSIFIFYIVAIGLLFFRLNGYFIFYGILFTIGVINLYFRRKRSMYKRNLPLDLLKSLKDRLVNKEKALKEEQQNLIKEDPYLQGDRATGNAENLDEAILEDYSKTLNDAQQGFVKSVRLQVRKALAAIKIGKYGICEVCGNPIDKARLRALPEATTCIECAQKASEAEDAKI